MSRNRFKDFDRDRVSQQRRALYEAREQGLSREEAFAIANGRPVAVQEAPAPDDDNPKTNTPTTSQQTGAGGGNDGGAGTTNDPGTGGGQGEGGGGGTPNPLDAIEIPDNWQDLKWNDLRKLAAQISPGAVANRDECEAAIRAELGRRAQQQ